MSRMDVVPYRIVTDVPHVYRVEREDTGKVLGKVSGNRTEWRAQASKMAFLGDGPDGAEPLGDFVPRELYHPQAYKGDLWLPGVFTTQRAAILALQRHLYVNRAPAMGFGAHPDVRPKERC
jgi:hypothetical protein